MTILTSQTDLIKDAIEYGNGAIAFNIIIGDYVIASRYNDMYILKVYDNGKTTVDITVDTYEELRDKMLDLVDWYAIGNQWSNCNYA